MAFLPMAQYDPELIQQLLVGQQLQARNRPPQSETGQAFYGLADSLTGALGAYTGLQARDQQRKELGALGEALAKNLPPDQQAIAAQLLGNPQTAPMVVKALAEQSFARPKEYTLAPGAVRYRGNQQIAAAPAKAAQAPSDFRLAEAMGFDLRTPEGRKGFAAFKQSTQKGTTVSLKTEGPIPPGFRAERDASGAVVALTPLPGSDAAHERAQDEEKEAGRQAAREQAADIVTEDIDRALGMIERPDFELPRTGAAGAALAGVPGTAAHDLQQVLLGVGANIGFDRLQEMRNNSPTGGALGNITEGEVKRLESVKGSIAQSQSAEQLRYNLNRLKRLYLETIHGKEAAAKMGGSGGSTPKTKPPLTPAQLQSMSLDELADYYAK